MALVDYSDSEGSDSDVVKKQHDAATAASTTEKQNESSSTIKPGFKKVVDSSNPHKIRVNLPVVSNSESSKDGKDIDERPVKRARTGGGLSDFNALLPAPKNAATGSGSSSLLKGRATGLKQGVSLKTGATPAFSRDPNPSAEVADEGDEAGEADFSNERQSAEVDEEASQNAPPSAAPAPEVTTTVKPMMFKPLSVGKKNTRKKKAPLPPSEQGDSQPSAVSAANPDERSTEPVKPKRSLFAAYEPETASSAAAEDDYEPLLDDAPAEPNPISSESTVAQAAPTQTKDLNTLADDLELTPAQRRQLFGRNGKASGAQVTHFSVSEEYSNNNAMRASEANAAPVHNPVRTIAPGKHSLQQLVNAATSQKDALEESFASGKRNKKAAGTKYGW